MLNPIIRAILSQSRNRTSTGGQLGNAPVFSQQTAPPGTTGAAYSYTFVASGSPTYSLFAGGTLPPGLTLSPAGVLSGTPTTANSYVFTVVATNGNGSTNSTVQGIVVSLAGAITYDNRVGLAADSAGIPDLTLHGSATRVWYHPTSGSNGNGGVSTTGSLTLSQMKATLGGGTGAWQALRSGFGDHLMVPAGLTATEQLPNLAARTGLSAQYPIVVTTYDPSDPSNSSLWRTGEFTLDVRDPTSDGPTGGGDEAMRMNGGSINRVAWENVRFYQPQIVDPTLYKQTLIFITGDGAGSGTLNFDCSMLFHSCRFDGTQITTQYTGIEYPTEKHYLQNIVFRHCAFFLSRGQGMYAIWQDGYMVEDCVFWHAGWSPDGTRSTATEAPTQFDHNSYHDCEGLNTTYRRCVFAEGSLHGLMLRCGGVVDDCIFLENALGYLLGGGVHYNAHKPDGVDAQSTGCIVLDGTDCEPGTLAGGGINAVNTTSGSFVTDFIVAHSNVAAPGYNRFSCIASCLNGTWPPTSTSNAFEPGFPVHDTYIAFTNGIVRNWPNGSGYATIADRWADTMSASEIAKTHVTVTNCVWEGDTSITGGTYGTGNTSTPGVAFPNGNYKTADLATSLGYGSKALMYTAMVAAPRTHWARSMSNLVRAAYGKSARF